MRPVAALLAALLTASCSWGGADDVQPDRVQLIFDGQSLVLFPPDGVPFPRFLQSILPAERYPDVDVVAVGSTTYLQRATDADRRVDELVSEDTVSVLVDVAGQSDLRGDDTPVGATAAELLAQAERYARARREAGIDLYVIATVPPDAELTAREEAERLVYNQLLPRSDEFDAVVDLAAIPETRLQRDPTWYLDGTHPTSALAALYAFQVEQVLEELGLPVR
jgi:lysophospholipase L1-like esterase